ncbi:MAG: hydroxymethylglutaryl-CoA reductase, degradative [Bacteroidetes bacterium]|nr:MAG: hydroxymethylglutaryl-CoA reductase, degradative [Bacteroidota bacterium]
MKQPIKGFSKLSKEGKIEWLVNEHFENPEEARELLKEYWHSNEKRQQLHDDFIENTMTNYFLPFGVAPNFLINNQLYTLPMTIEESSVVAAASKAAGFWLKRGGFKTEIISTTKVGHVHFNYAGSFETLSTLFEDWKPKFYEETEELTANMRARGGGILSIALVNKTDVLENYYQIEARFETCDSMGANFINSCLEQFAQVMRADIELRTDLSTEDRDLQVVMCILSNYTPECVVRAEVSCKVEELNDDKDVSPEEFASKFQRAVRIAEVEPYRATTHNKGIMNGIDAVVIATGNDFRAIEAASHTYASRNGQYSSLTHCKVENGVFTFWIEIPLALGTVGGLTKLHPMVKLAHEMLGHPNSETLMGIVAASGLAQNFAALRALVTTGIQKGHMKMHLFNILNQLEATPEERDAIVKHFTDKVPHHNLVVSKFCELRGIPVPKSGVNKDK